MSATNKRISKINKKSRAFSANHYMIVFREHNDLEGSIFI